MQDLRGKFLYFSNHRRARRCPAGRTVSYENAEGLAYPALRCNRIVGGGILDAPRADASIRPIISLNAGVSKVESKVRGDAAVPAAMIKWVESRVDSMKDTPYMVAYTSSTAKRDELVKLCKKAFGHAPLIVFQLGGVVSANTGPDGIAIVYEGKPRNLEAYAPELP